VELAKRQPRTEVCSFAAMCLRVALPLMLHYSIMLTEADKPVLRQLVIMLGFHKV
jgi:hypothetical protein